MSLSDPQSITIGSTPGTVSLPRVNTAGDRSVYRSSDSSIELIPSTIYGRRVRRSVRVNFEKVSADVFRPDTNVSLSMSCFVVWDVPVIGFSATEQLDVYKGLTGQLSASTYAVATKVLGGES